MEFPNSAIVSNFDKIIHNLLGAGGHGRAWAGGG